LIYQPDTIKIILGKCDGALIFSQLATAQTKRASQPNLQTSSFFDTMKASICRYYEWIDFHRNGLHSNWMDDGLIDNPEKVRPITHLHSIFAIA
jgi:hypothetical protein